MNFPGSDKANSVPLRTCRLGGALSFNVAVNTHYLSADNRSTFLNLTLKSVRLIIIKKKKKIKLS